MLPALCGAVQPDGSLLLTTEKGDTIATDIVMFATGRKANTAHLGLDKVGVELNPDGAIKVDEYSKSNIDSIYAVGDVTNRINLTPVALHEGHCFADTLFGGKDRRPNHEHVAAAVFSQPPISGVGLTQEQAAKKHKKVCVGCDPPPNHVCGI